MLKRERDEAKRCPSFREADSRSLESHPFNASLGLEYLDVQFVIILHAGNSSSAQGGGIAMVAYSLYFLHFSLEFFVLCLVLDVFGTGSDACGIGLGPLSRREGGGWLLVVRVSWARRGLERHDGREKVR
jgi:hypothetical protein